MPRDPIRQVGLMCHRSWRGAVCETEGTFASVVTRGAVLWTEGSVGSAWRTAVHGKHCWVWWGEILVGDLRSRKKGRHNGANDERLSSEYQRFGFGFEGGVCAR